MALFARFAPCRLVLIPLLLCLAMPLAGQSAGTGTDTALSPFRPLDLPTPNSYRTGSGRPGPDYWQQRVDYRIAATLDTATQTIHGRETIHYVNNSPDSLPYLWFFVEQNICAPNSITNQLDQPPLVFLSSTFDFSCQGFAGGGTLEQLRSGGKDLKLERYGTTMRVELPAPVAPGATVDIEAAWHFRVPPYGAGRMGRDGSLYEVAQWYPRLAVYDDIHGWNHEPYIGAGEFYLEYGSFDVTLTVPASYLIAATGQLLNADSVLTADQRTRLARARRSDSTVAIISAAEVGKPSTRPTMRGMLTWHFAADSVRDFAWAASPNVRWDASGYNGALIETVYRPAATAWTEANRMAREAIKYFSEQWYPYPYSHATTVEGPVEGMEYPMLTFVPNSPNREELQWVVSHEFGHEWFPMVVGSNERLYPWMDEGFNTFIDLGGAAHYFKGTPYGDSIEVHPLHLYAEHAIRGREQPLITRPVEVHDLFWTGYQKPALMMQTLRYEVLGPARFDDAFRRYIRAWAYKHPAPADFFRMMRDASGMDLDWFWRSWVYRTDHLDQAVDSVVNADSLSMIYLSSRDRMVLPLEMDVTYADGSVDRVRLPVEMWNLGPQFTYRVRNGKAVRRVVVDPRRALPDDARANNVWPR
ncbi:MAG TPA: M1 family metallopeptidase [Gemmatimonadales bacterium]|nr:M1 family metallopeptidase [Gemmatimonadales bacterium]